MSIYKYITKVNLQYIKQNIKKFYILEVDHDFIVIKDNKYLMCGDWYLDDKSNKDEYIKRYTKLKNEFPENTPKILNIDEIEYNSEKKYIFINDKEIFILSNNIYVSLLFKNNTLFYIDNDKIEHICMYFKNYKIIGEPKNNTNNIFKIIPKFDNNNLKEIIFELHEKGFIINYKETFYNNLFNTISPITIQDLIIENSDQYFSVNSNIKSISIWQSYSRFVRREIYNILPSFEDKINILDIGAGRGGDYFQIKKKYNFSKLYCLEPDLNALLEYQTRLIETENKCTNIEMINSPFNHKLKFDNLNLIISQFAIHYYTSTEKYMNELLEFIQNNLKTGYFVFTVMTKTKLLKNKKQLLLSGNNSDWDIKFGINTIDVLIKSFSNKFITETMFDDELFKKIFNAYDITEIDLYDGQLEKKFKINIPYHVKLWFSCYSLFIIH